MGAVEVEMFVSEHGTVESVVILGSNPDFDEYAEEAALNWKFDPAKRSGAAISCYCGFRKLCPRLFRKIWPPDGLR
jgi:TonB family protein